MEPPVIFLRPSLNVWTYHSTNPFEAGWYGGVRTCLMSLAFKNTWNLSLQKTDPLSEIRTCGSPNVAKVICNLSIVIAAVEDDVT